MRLTLPESLAGSWKDDLDGWIATQPELDAELGHATLEEELTVLAACGLLEEAWEAAAEMREILNSGCGILPARHAGSLVLFHALGLNPFNPLDDGVDDLATLGVRTLDRPVWTWFGGRPARDRVVVISEIEGMSMAQVREACTWGPQARAALTRYRSRPGAGEEWAGEEAPEVPDTWHRFVLQRAGNSLGPAGAPKWTCVLDRERTALRSELDCFLETAGVPVFEDQLLAFAESLPGGDDPKWRWRFRSLVRGARRAEHREELESLSLPRHLLEVLICWGPTTWPRAGAIAEARLELVAAWRTR